MKQRLDRLLVEQKLAPSREKAQALIMAGKVRVDGQPAGKSGRVIDVDSHLEVLGKDQPFVSRGGVKLQAALEHFKINPSGLVALDIGSSTGGFSHCLILGGAEKVFANDVGYGQLAWELQQNPCVVSLERTNFRHLEFERLGETVDLVVIDVSFISLRLIFPKAL
ncbi:MAG: TlyA family RNA methyltransferase, partial [SAR324 cluster bacterium]|nr:TlyA family RNA methyltransferase [SAR324 cluster bacterium]